MSIGERTLRALTRTLKIGITLGFIMAVVTFIGVEHTSRPEFCKTCHNMVPYYESWESSTHNMVPCIDCHYEPGLIETVQGKFTAVTQLAKYVTRTAGTKPWAEVSDQSCMRPGCHAKRLLEGQIPFSRVKFDHRVHVLELRRGKRLRCTSCHSQIVQGSHIAVTTSTCFLCHFKPSPKGERLADCYVCHGPPTEPVAIEGVDFVHAEYLDRGVACRECHADVTRGDGRVPRVRCNSCHGEAEHIERYDDVEFIHRNHVTDHKVECLECHEEITHSLERRGLLAQESGSCARCHAASHSLQEAVYAGAADPELDPNPSRMHLTRVSCEACHHAWADSAGAGSARSNQEISCAHCHGPGFLDMTVSWEQSVRSAYEPLKRNLRRLEAALDADGGGEAARRPRERLFRARRRLQLVEEDGSWGAHNLDYVYRLLDLANEDLVATAEELDPGAPLPAVAVGPRFQSEFGCTRVCHIDAEKLETVFNGLRFVHGPHLESAGLDCDSCHDPGRHGESIVTGDDCQGCHEPGDAIACKGCHVAQRATAEGKGATGIEETPSWMVDLDCDDCHTRPHESGSRSLTLESCVGCHEAGYDEMVDAWQQETKARLERLESARTNVSRLQVWALTGGASPPGLREAESLRKRAEEYLAWVRRDRSLGVHNIEFTELLLDGAAKRLRQAEELLRERLP